MDGFNQQEGQDLVHGELIQQVLDSLKLPGEIAIVYVPGHQRGVNFETQGNLLQMRQPNRLLSPLRSWSSVLSCTFLPPKEQQLKKLGAIRTKQGKWVLPNGREMISKLQMRELLTYHHQRSHWGPQDMCDVGLQAYGCIETYSLAKQVSEGCLTC
jgi:hypothetical protein